MTMMIKKWLPYWQSAGLGGLSVYAYAPYRLYWLMPLLLVGLFRLTLNSDKPIRIAYIWGIASGLSNFSWLYASMHDVAGMLPLLSWGLVFLFALYYGSFFALAALLVRLLAARFQKLELWIWPLAWLLVELLKNVLFTGFPFGVIGYTQIAESPLAGYTPIVGVFGVSLAVSLSAALLLFVCQSQYSMFSSSQGLALVGLLSLWGGGALLKSIHWTETEGKPITVALLQGNIEQTIKWNEATLWSTLTLYETMMREQTADLIILPETALPLFYEELPGHLIAQWYATLSSKHQALAMGILHQVTTEMPNVPVTLVNANAVVSFDSSTQKVDFYYKNHLVPFGEYTPLKSFLGTFYDRVAIPFANLYQGKMNQAPIFLSGQKIAFNICYEDGFGEELRLSARKSTIMANVSNLAWFGRNSIAMDQHLQQSQARALENGRPLVRATNTGRTAFILPNGQIKSQLPTDIQDVLVDGVQGMKGVTPYQKWGDMLIMSVAFVWFCLILFVRWQKRDDF
ncbi:MAG: apolipoprotein N-acyltransferase [Neisseriaceae bacterium]|nr:apolipoprotein N-acyltransferase [Neisseriaceae bacterium]